MTAPDPTTRARELTDGNAWKVACINWSYPDAPHAMAYLMRAGQMVADWYFPTHAEAIAHADLYARKGVR